MQKFLYSLVVCVFFAGAAVTRPALADEARFIQTLADQALVVLQDGSASLEERKRRFQKLLQDGFAMALIGRFVVGRLWQGTAGTIALAIVLLIGLPASADRFDEGYAAYQKGDFASARNI